MTEDQWLGCQNPEEMLRWLGCQRKVSERRFRLFAVACCRRIWPFLKDPQSRAAVKMAEHYADGRANASELASAQAALSAGRSSLHGGTGWVGRVAAAKTAWPSQAGEALRAVTHVAQTCSGIVGTHEAVAQCMLLRCIFGNPFRATPTIKPGWCTPTVFLLAQCIYRNRAFDLMPQLGSVLARAGCQDSQLLRHCRGHEPHARGCHLLDALFKAGAR